MFMKPEGCSFTLNYAYVFHDSMKPQNSGDFNSYIYILYYQPNIYHY